MLRLGFWEEKMLFSELSKLYLADKRDGRKAVRANTLEGYTSAIRTHLMPRWGQMEVESVTYEQVQSWVDSFPEGKGAEKAYKTLRQMVRWAIAKRLVVMPDCTVGVEVPKPKRRAATVLDDKQLNRMLYACKGEPWEAVVWCQACLGLRRCEAVALTWGDIDLRSGVVRIDKGRHVVGGRVYVWGTKTPKSTREVVLPRFAVERLRAIKRERRARADELLCDMRPDAISRRFRSWCRRNGFAGLTMMQLRHSFATIAVRAGLPIEVVAMMLGHTDISMCYERYVSRSIDVFRVNIRRFADLVLRAAPDTRLARPQTPALVA
jgi:integrase